MEILEEHEMQKNQHQEKIWRREYEEFVKISLEVY